MITLLFKSLGFYLILWGMLPKGLKLAGVFLTAAIFFLLSGKETTSSLELCFLQGVLLGSVLSFPILLATSLAKFLSAILLNNPKVELTSVKLALFCFFSSLLLPFFSLRIFNLTELINQADFTLSPQILITLAQELFKIISAVTLPLLFFYLFSATALIFTKRIFPKLSANSLIHSSLISLFSLGLFFSLMAISEKITQGVF